MSIETDRSSDVLRESRPVPDPTVLTTQQLLREVAMMRELLETRLNGMDKAIELLQKTTDKYPSFVESQVKQLQQLHEEKFRSVAIQFIERDTRTEQTSRDSKVAVDAALQAAKEAVGEQNKSNALANAKMETAFTKQLDQITVIINTTTAGLGDKIDTTTKGLSDKIDDAKTRMNGYEGRLTTIEGRSKGAGDSWGIIFSVIAAVASIAIVIAIVFGRPH